MFMHTRLNPDRPRPSSATALLQSRPWPISLFMRRTHEFLTLIGPTEVQQRVLVYIFDRMPDPASPAGLVVPGGWNEIANAVGLESGEEARAAFEGANPRLFLRIGDQSAHVFKAGGWVTGPVTIYFQDPALVARSDALLRFVVLK